MNDLIFNKINLYLFYSILYMLFINNILIYLYRRLKLYSYFLRFISTFFNYSFIKNIIIIL